MIGLIPERINNLIYGNSPWVKGLRLFVTAFCQGTLYDLGEHLEESPDQSTSTPDQTKLEASQVDSNWWAVDWQTAKCNLWLFDTSVNLRENLFCTRIDLIIIMVNLSDIQAVRQLENYKKVIKELPGIKTIVLGTYMIDSALVADQKVKVLEWLVEDDRLADSAFLLVDLNSDSASLIRIWKEIFSYGLN